MEGQPKEEGEPLRSPLRLGGERVKRDEWGDGAVDCLLGAYESKWILRNRAKLKGQDWDDVARQVSTRGPASSGRSEKTATQCKNKIESMKKRYRNEVATGSGSRWPLFSKIDGLVRCRAGTTATATPGAAAAALVVVDCKSLSCDQRPAPVQSAAAGAGAQTSQSADANGVSAAAAQAPQEDHIQRGGRLRPTEMDGVGSDQNAASCDSSKENHEARRRRMKRRRMKEEGWEIMESVRWLAEVTLRVEQSRMEAMREVEKMRAETEARRGEMDLKRTEIIANTQLQIAKLFARRITGRSNSSTRTGRD